MKRRSLIQSALGTAAVAGAANLAAASGRPAIFELRRYQLRNGDDNQSQRLNEFLSKIGLPAASRAGVGPIGVFGSVIAENTPFVITVASHASLAALEASQDKMAADKEYRAAREAFFGTSHVAYTRVETRLLRAFPGMPSMEIPATDGRQSSRIFELRTYESNNSVTLARKIRMFEEGEIAIFRRTGLQPVFFGETIVGPNMPNLTYLLAFDDIATRDKNWGAFVKDPAWEKLRTQPGYADSEIVSNISNCILRPLPYSQIR